MDTSKIIKGVVSNGRYTVTAPIVKEDYGLYLKIEGVELPSTYEVDFSNSENNGTSVTMIGNADGVLIPHQFIETGKDVFAFLYHVGENFGRTVYKFRIPNKVRPDRTDETPTPEEQSVIDQAISALNTAVAQTAQDKADADVSAQNAKEDADRAEQAKDDASTFAQRSANSAQASADYSESAQASATASANSASQSAQIKTDVESMVDDAQSYAQSAEQSAQNAHTYALSANAASGTAENFADVASGYASQAQSSAQTASAKAQDASGYAQTASQKATEASQSASQASGYAQTAESAKTDAQTAQGKAEDAQTAAETAQGLAEDARDEAQTLVDSITGKVEQIDSNTERIESLEDDRYKPYVVDTASGAIASFPDGADDIPLKSLVVDINPVQDLSQGDPSPENICPISGWTGMKIEHTGKNLLNLDTNITVLKGSIPSAVSITNGSGSATITEGYYSRTANIFGWAFNVKQNQDYTCSFVYNSANRGNAKIYTADGTTLVTFEASNGKVTKTFNTGENSVLYFYVSISSWDQTMTITNVQIEYGTTATDYEPYNGTTLPISWQTEAGTVYGGSLDVLSGKLTVDMVTADLGTLAWYYITTQGRNYFLAAIPNRLNNSKMVCSMYPWKGNSTDSSMGTREDATLWGDFNGSAIKIKDSSYADATLFKTAMSGVQLCYELAEPIEIQLTPHEVNSLLGVNNIFADTGDTEVIYRADTKTWVQRKIAEAISALS